MLVLPETSVAVMVTVYIRPLPLPDRSARSCRVIVTTPVNSSDSFWGKVRRVAVPGQFRIG